MDGGMSKEDSPRRPTFYAWEETPGPSRRLADERPTPPEEKAAPPASATLVEGFEDLSVEAEALSFVRAFLETSEQDIAQKMTFLEQLGIIFEAKTVEGFRLFPSDLLIRVVEVLIPWTASGNNLERKTTAETLARICSAVRVLCGYRATTEFPVMGQLVGCLTLCHYDNERMVAYWAARGLHHLYAFAARCRGKSTAEQELLARVLRREGDGEDEEDPLESAMIIPTLFKEVLSPAEVSDLYLTALHGLQETSAQKIHAAVCVEKALRADPAASLGKVREVVIFLHGHLDSFQDRLAHEDLNGILHTLKERHLSEVVHTLLSCSPLCDSSAATLWGMLVSRSCHAEEVLHHLLACLQGQPQKPLLSEEEIATLRLAAAHVLPRILEQPPLSLRLVLQAQWEAACLSLVFWVSHLHRGAPGTTPSHGPERAEDESERLARSSVGTLRRLLEEFRPEELPNDDTIWERLGSADTFHQGVTLLFQALHSLSSEELQHVAAHVMCSLRGHDEHQAVTAMNIFKELLRRAFIPITQEVLRHLTAQLRSPNEDLHSLALDGLLAVADKPEQVWKLLPLLPEVANNLQESDLPNTRRLFSQLQRSLEDISSPALAAGAAGHLLPLFDAECYVARNFAIHNFRAMLGRGATRALRDLALRSLAPLLLHLHDESSIVVEACWQTLSTAAILLGHRKLHRLVLIRDKWSTCRIFGKRFRKVAACSFQEQILGHLRSPQVSVREAAIRILGLLGEETRDRRKLEVINRALRGMRSDEQESIRSCAVLATYALEALPDEDPPARSLQERLRRLCGACCSSA
ncbi:UNVERIFIED_CONTAM: hypothetical protein K2H54_011884 [Gekko kuhli]